MRHQLPRSMRHGIDKLAQQITVKKAGDCDSDCAISRPHSVLLYCLEELRLKSTEQDHLCRAVPRSHAGALVRCCHRPAWFKRVTYSLDTVIARRSQNASRQYRHDVRIHGIVERV